MSTRKKLSIALFDSYSLGHNAYGLWNHPDDRRQQYLKLEHWIDKARIADAGGIDCLFFADNLGVADQYRGSIGTSVAYGVHIPALDPAVIVSALAHETSQLNFAVSASTSYEAPYTLARRLSTLDHVTQGRIAWNVVTTATASAAANFNLDKPIDHDERYDIADEFIEVCYKLWEGSWEDDAIDRRDGRYADPAKVHAIAHHGRYFQVAGPHLAEPSVQRTPVLFQAGSSKRGRQFAAQHAECVLLGGSSIEEVATYVRSIRELAAQYGRGRDSVKLFKGLAILTGRDREEVSRKFEDYKTYWQPEAALANFCGAAHLDVAQLDPDGALPYFETIGHQTRLAQYTRAAGGARTVREVIRSVTDFGKGAGSLSMLAGTPVEVADYIERLVDEADIDGLHLAQWLTPASLVDFVELVAPELRRRGLMRDAVHPEPFRHRLFGQDRLLADHPGHQYRNLSGAGAQHAH